MAITDTKITIQKTGTEFQSTPKPWNSGKSNSNLIVFTKGEAIDVYQDELDSGLIIFFAKKQNDIFPLSTLKESGYISDKDFNALFNN